MLNMAQTFSSFQYPLHPVEYKLLISKFNPDDIKSFSAKAWIKELDRPATWKDFEFSLLKLFFPDNNFKLMTRKKQISEGYTAYFYDVDHIGKRAGFSEAAIIKYIVPGIEDEVLKNNLAAQRPTELKELLWQNQLFGQVKSKKGNAKAEEKPNTHFNNDKGKSNVNCFPCGENGHVATRQQYQFSEF